MKVVYPSYKKFNSLLRIKKEAVSHLRQPLKKIKPYEAVTFFALKA